jgi:hypothetical protein
MRMKILAIPSVFILVLLAGGTFLATAQTETIHHNFSTNFYDGEQRQPKASSLPSPTTASLPSRGTLTSLILSSCLGADTKTDTKRVKKSIGKLVRLSLTT